MVVLYCIKNWINQIGLCLILKLKITLFYLLSFVFIRFIIRCHLLSLIVIFGTCCHSLSFAVTRCTICYHSLYHSLAMVVPLIITRCHSMYHSSTRLSFYKRLYDCDKSSLSYSFFPSFRNSKINPLCESLKEWYVLIMKLTGVDTGFWKREGASNSGRKTDGSLSLFEHFLVQE